MTHPIDLEVFLAVDLELSGPFVVRIVQNIVTLGVPTKKVLILNTVCTNKAKPIKTSEEKWHLDQYQDQHWDQNSGFKSAVLGLTSEPRLLEKSRTVAPEASCHGQQAPPGFCLWLLWDRWKVHRNGVHTAQRPWPTWRLAAWGWSTWGTGARLRLGFWLWLGAHVLGGRLGWLGRWRCCRLMWTLFRHVWSC